MPDVSRSEFDALAERVARIERTLGATVELIGSELIGLRSYADARFDAVDARFDAVEGKLDRYTEQVNTALKVASETGDRHERFMTAIADHFGIELQGS